MENIKPGLGKAESPTLSIPYKWVVGVGFLYLLVPICIFLCTWIRWYIGIPAAVILSLGFVALMRGTYLESQERIVVPVYHFLVIAILFLVWVWTTGIGNFFVSAYDHPWRIAIFRDLINFSWPVVYTETGNALVYYLLYWMVPALFGKAFGWAVGNIALLVWTYIGILITFFMLLYACGSKTKGEIIAAAILLFGWSGLNTIGGAIVQIININPYQFFALNCQEDWLNTLYNGYSFNFLYRPNSGALNQIYNQTTPLWIATLLTLDNQKRPKNFAFIGLCLFPFAPLPFIGLLIIMLVFFCVQLRKSIKQHITASLVKGLFSIQNLTAAVIITPIMGMFFFCNTTVSSESGGFYLLPLELFDHFRVTGIVLFWIFQFGVIAALIFPKYKRSYLFYTLVISLVLIPFVEFGQHGGRDFCMNASLPALFLLMVLTLRYLNERVIKKELSFRNLLIVIVLALSMLSPIQDIAAKLDAIGDQNKFPIVNDYVYTISDKPVEGYENFLSSNYENTTFFKYIAK